MPNWVINRLTFEGKGAMDALKSHIIKNEDGEDCFDFNTVEKMPDELRIENSSKQYLALKLAISKRFPGCDFYGDPNDKINLDDFNVWIDKLYKNTIYDLYDSVLSDKQELESIKEKYNYPNKEWEDLLAFGERCISNLEKYGVTDWYDWAKIYWGVKWNAANTFIADADGKATVYFDTAWGTPAKMLETLAKQHPDLIIKHDYAEEQIAYMCGHDEYIDGKLTVENSYDSYSKEAYEMYFDLWGCAEDFIYDEKKGTYVEKEIDENEEEYFLQRRLPDEESKNKIKVIYKEPNKPYEILTIDDDYKELSKRVGGLIDITCLPTDRSISVIFNDEFLYNGMESNIIMPETENVFCGPLIFTGTDFEEGTSISLSDEQIKTVESYLAEYQLENVTDIEEAYEMAIYGSTELHRRLNNHELIQEWQKKVDHQIEAYGRVGGKLYDELDEVGLYIENDNKVRFQVKEKNEKLENTKEKKDTTKDKKPILSKTKQFIVDEMIKALDQGTVPWRKGWTSEYEYKAPFNYASGRHYNGINFISLYFSGKQDPRWMTWHQINDKGFKLKKGAKGYPVELHKNIDTETGKEITVDEYIKGMQGLSGDDLKEYMDRFKHLTRTSIVFNGEDIEGIPEYKKVVKELDFKKIKKCENILLNSEAPIYEDSDSAYYSPKKDEIHLPKRTNFESEEEFYGTAFHEIAHSTGHPSRLNRDFNNTFGSEKYAIEELRAEIASMFIQSEIGIDYSQSVFENHVAYISSWKKSIQEDPNALFKAISDAAKISDYVKAYDKENNNISGKLYFEEIFSTNGYPEPKKEELEGKANYIDHIYDTVDPTKEVSKEWYKVSDTPAVLQGLDFKNIPIMIKKDTLNNLLYCPNENYVNVLPLLISDPIAVIQKDGSNDITLITRSPSDYVVEINLNYQKDYREIEIGTKYEKVLGNSEGIQKYIDERINNNVLIYFDAALAKKIHLKDEYISGKETLSNNIRIPTRRDKVSSISKDNLVNFSLIIPEYLELNIKPEDLRDKSYKEMEECIKSIKSQIKDKVEQYGSYYPNLELIVNYKDKNLDAKEYHMLISSFGETISLYDEVDKTFYDFSNIEVDENTIKKYLQVKNEILPLIKKYKEEKSQEKTVEKKVARMSREEYFKGKNLRRIENIEKNCPQEMKDLHCWCVFKTFTNKESGKKQKKIISPATGNWAKCNDENDFVSFEEAIKYAKEKNCEGLSFALLPENNIACIDLDHCIDENNNRTKLAWQLVHSASTNYVEKSVSQKGLHFFFKTTDPKEFERYNKKNDKECFECYTSSKFISITGYKVNEKEVKLCPCELNDIAKVHLGESTTNYRHNSISTTYLSTDEIIEKIRSSKKGDEFNQLFSGVDVCGDDSRSDMKLLNILAFFTNCDPTAMESIFLQSGLYRPEKGEKYIKRSIDFAINTLQVRPEKDITKSNDNKNRRDYTRGGRSR